MSEVENINHEPSDDNHEISDENMSSAETLSTINSPLSTEENMEVHAHTHTERKKITHYLWEFLMLFLAVFCGFLAENQREYLLENRHEQEYMENLLQDLKADTASLSNEIKSRYATGIAADSLVNEINLPVNDTVLSKIYFNAFSLTASRIFSYSNTTIQELKSSGLMRLIRKNGIADSINAHDLNVQRYKMREDLEMGIQLEYRKAIAYVLDANVMMTMGDSLFRINSAGYMLFTNRPGFIKPLLTKDPDKINYVKGLAAQLHTRNTANANALNLLLKKAIRTIELLKKEYYPE